jgi:Zn-dependent alcohol dehydrogenase
VTMKIRAAVLSQTGAKTPYAGSRPLSIEEVELDPPGPGEVLVKMGAAGLSIRTCPRSAATSNSHDHDQVRLTWRLIVQR